MVKACQAPVLEFFKKVQKAVGPPEVSQTMLVVPVNVSGVHGSPRGPNVAGVTDVSVGGTTVVEGYSWDCKLDVFGALPWGFKTTSDEIVTVGSPTWTAAPLFFGGISTQAFPSTVPVAGGRI